MTAFPLLTEFSAVCCPFVIAFLALGTNNSSGWDFCPYFRQVVSLILINEDQEELSLLILNTDFCSFYSS